MNKRRTYLIPLSTGEQVRIANVAHADHALRTLRDARGPCVTYGVTITAMVRAHRREGPYGVCCLPGASPDAIERVTLE